jgi:hypothetical protein
LSSQLLIDASRQARLSASRSAFLAAISLVGGGGAHDRDRLAQRGVQDHLAVGVADLSELGPDLDDGGGAAFDDVVLGDLAGLDLLVLEDGHGGASSRLVAVSHVETTISSRDLIADTFDRQTGSNDLVTSRKSNDDE